MKPYRTSFQYNNLVSACINVWCSQAFVSILLYDDHLFWRPLLADLEKSDDDPAASRLQLTKNLSLEEKFGFFFWTFPDLFSCCLRAASNPFETVSYVKMFGLLRYCFILSKAQVLQYWLFCSSSYIFLLSWITSLILDCVYVRWWSKQYYEHVIFIQAA